MTDPPPDTPVRFTVGPRPEHGVDAATHVVAGGFFDHTDRHEPGTYSAALHGLMTGDRDRIPRFTALLNTVLDGALDVSRYDVVTLVPNHDGGIDPELRSVATRLPIPYDQLVTRTTPVKPNKSIEDPGDRWKNVADSIEAACAVDGDRVLVVDDVLSSGASLAVTAAALRRSDADTVVGAVLGVRPSGAGHDRQLQVIEPCRTS